MWLFEFRLYAENADKFQNTEGEKIQKVLDFSGAEEKWQRIGVIYTEEIREKYGTPEMLKTYGNEYTSAAMELYKKSLEDGLAGNNSATGQISLNPSN